MRKDDLDPRDEWARASAASHAPLWTLRVVCECGRTYGDDGVGHPGLLEFACVCGRRASVDASRRGAVATAWVDGIVGDE